MKKKKEDCVHSIVNEKRTTCYINLFIILINLIYFSLVNLSWGKQKQLRKISNKLTYKPFFTGEGTWKERHMFFNLSRRLRLFYNHVYIIITFFDWLRKQMITGRWKSMYTHFLLKIRRVLVWSKSEIGWESTFNEDCSNDTKSK